MMQLTNQESPVMAQALELCRVLVDHPEFQTIRQHLAAFSSDEKAQEQYQNLSEKSNSLQQKQRQGQELSDVEIDEYEQQREALLNNTIARNFLDAQQTMREVQNAVGKYLAKTFELGRLPGSDDLNCGTCSSCNCH